MSAAAASRSTVPSMGCGYVVCAVLVLAGAALIYAARAQHTPRRATETWIGVSFGMVMCFGGLALIAPMQRAVAAAKERARRESARPHEPWTWDPAWTNPRGIVQARRRHGTALLIFGVVAAGMSVPPAIFILPRDVAKGEYGALALLIFPVVSAGMIAVAAVDAWRRRKYGVAHFVPAAVPVPLGSELAGMVVIDRPVRPTGAGRAELDCWRTSVSRSGGKRRQHEETISHTERAIAPEDWRQLGRETQLYVQLPLRGGTATTMTNLASDSPTHEWRLRVAVPTAGADFVAEFTLPVFEVAGGATAGTASETPSGAPAANRADIWRTAEIVSEPQPGAIGGERLVLPRAAGRKLIWTPLLMSGVPAGIAVAIVVGGGPTFIAVLLGMFAVLPALLLPSLWNGGGERVWVERDTVCVQAANGSERRLVAGNFERFEVKRSVSVGSQQFYGISARQRPDRPGRFGKIFRVATMVRGDEAARDVVAWIEERLTRPGA